MNGSSRALSAEIKLGLGLVVAGLSLHATGWHAVFAQALAPFGVGLILSDLLGRFGRAAREQVRLYLRRDD